MKIFELKRYVLSPTLALALVCFILAGISFLIPKQKTRQTTSNVASRTTNPTPSPVLGTETTIAPTEVVVTQIVYPASNAANATTPIPTPIQSGPTQTTSNVTSRTTSTQSSDPQVAMTISEPDGTNNFTIDFHGGMTVCDTLTEAKNEGKIKSVTIDNSYQASLHSSYVKEINGYSNNWTFTVNGNSPQGCSLYSVNQGDSVVWKYD